jgi:hypothetical protein
MVKRLSVRILVEGVCSACRGRLSYIAELEDFFDLSPDSSEDLEILFTNQAEGLLEENHKCPKQKPEPNLI